MPSWSFSTVQQINWGCLFFIYVYNIAIWGWSLFKLYVLCFLLQVPLSHWLWWYFINTQASKKITLCLQRLWHVYLFLSNRFLSEWIKEGGFLFWYFIQPCVSVRGWGVGWTMVSFACHPRKVHGIWIQKTWVQIPAWPHTWVCEPRPVTLAVQPLFFSSAN